jgi:osmoprotectant transport system permease protein
VTWFLNNYELVWQLALTHLWVAMLPVVIGSALATYLAWAARGRLGSALAAVLSAVYAIPSLALFVLLPPLLGTSYLGATNVIIALALYAAAVMFLAARDAYAGVDPALVENAQAQGFSRAQVFVGVLLPAAAPALVSGLRVVAASTISMASIGAVVGVRNLGYLFLDGFQRRIQAEIITGLLVTAALAIAIDLALWAVGRALMPWQRAGVAR